MNKIITWYDRILSSMDRHYFGDNYDESGLKILSSLLMGLSGSRRVGAGIRPGDVVIHINGGYDSQAKNSARELSNAEAYEMLERLSVIFAEAADIARKTPSEPTASPVTENDQICTICAEPLSAHVETLLGPHTHPREARGEGRYIKISDGFISGRGYDGEDVWIEARWRFEPYK